MLQKALFLEYKFGPFKVGEHDVPTPGPGELLVRVEAAGLNTIDWMVQKYAMYLDHYPAVLGLDISGVVEGIGGGVSRFSVGDRVLFQGSWENGKAGYQQYVLAHADRTAKVPLRLSLDEAASIPMTIATAVVGLFLPKPYGAGVASPFNVSTNVKYPGRLLVVLGGATSVGQYVIQLARLSGFTSIITTASVKHTEFLKSLGATHVLERGLSSAELAAAITKLTPAPIEIVFDAVSFSDTQATGYTLLSDSGTLVVVQPISDEIEVTPEKSISRVFGILTLPHTRELGIQFYAKLTELLDQGLIKPNRVEVIPGGLNGIVNGLERLEAKENSGVKLVVRPQETV